MPATPADVVRIAPEFTSVPSAVIQAYIDDASVLFGTDGMANDSRALFIQKWGAAHLMANVGVRIGPDGKLVTDPDAATRGPVTMESVGQVSRRYSPAAPAVGKVSQLSAMLSTTRYGQTLLTFLRRNAMHAAVV